MTKEYLEYLKTASWKEFRMKTLNNPFYGKPHRCFVCNSQKLLQVHHLTYEHIFEERPEDVMILCKYCHDKIKGRKDYEIAPFLLKKEFEKKASEAEKMNPAWANSGWRKKSKSKRKKWKKFFRVNFPKKTVNKISIEKLGTIAYYKLKRDGIIL